MGKTAAHKLIESHLVAWEMRIGSEIGLKIDQTLMQDATGTMVMLELEAMGSTGAKTEVSAQYVDHNILQTDCDCSLAFRRGSSHDRAIKYQKTGSILIGGSNYGQGSSREHAAIAPRYLGVQAVIAKSYARIHRKNLINFGIIPLEFINEADYDSIAQGDVLKFPHVREEVQQAGEIQVVNKTQDSVFHARHTLSAKELEELLAGGLLNAAMMRKKGS